VADACANKCLELLGVKNPTGGQANEPINCWASRKREAEQKKNKETEW